MSLILPTAPAPRTSEPALAPAQRDLARQRLMLGISNVGVWVLGASAALTWLLFATPQSFSLVQLHLVLLLLLAGQGVFDWIGGRLLIYQTPVSIAAFTGQWLRGMLVHTAVLVAGGWLTALSIRVVGHPAPALAILMIWLALGREWLLRAVCQTHVEGSALGLNLVRLAHLADPAFTGGSTVLQGDTPPLLPASWRERVPTAEQETERTRRQWQVYRRLPLRSWSFLLAWNAIGAVFSWNGLGLDALPLAAGILGYAAGMTLWGFVSLLLLPSLSRGSVLAADQAAAMLGHDPRPWIKLFPRLTGEDGNAHPIAQRVFYPIPSAAERLRHLEDPIGGIVLGNVARDNLFLSWATLSPLGRAVHCNAGRPALWVYPPSA